MSQFSKGLFLGLLLGLALLALTWTISLATPAPTHPATVIAVLSAPPAAATSPPATAPTDPLPTIAPPVAAPTEASGGGSESAPAQAEPTATATPDCREEPGVIERGTFRSDIAASTIISSTVITDTVTGAITVTSVIYGNGVRPFRVFLPPCYRPSGPAFPVLYMLHGSASTDSHWDDLGLDEAAAEAIRSGAVAPFVIAMPAGDLSGTFNFSGGGPRSFEAVMLDEFIPFIEQHYNVRSDRGGRAIGGLSRGAVWALEIAFRHPDLFLSVGAHSGAQSVAVASPMYQPIVLAAQAPNLDQLRIYMDTGESDWYRSGVVATHAALEARGIRHVFVLRPGAHEDAYWMAHVAEYVLFYAAPWRAPDQLETSP